MNLETALQSTNELMIDVVASDVPVLTEASRHIISAGGKRIRPQVMFNAYIAAGGTDVEYVIPVAAALELVHTATLVHDDINDHGIMRRGRETINELWGRTFALLTGDYLFTKVYTLMAPYQDMNITFAEATVALVEGETLQAHAAKNDNLNRDVYQQIVAKKTASLFRASAMLGAEAAQADQHTVDTLGEYGFFLGLMFQIVDDILDLTGDPRLMGKAAGVDVAQGKGVAVAQGENGNVVSAVLAEDEDDPYLETKRRLIAGGAVEEGREMVKALEIQANASLDKLAPSEAVANLREIITLVVERDH